MKIALYFDVGKVDNAILLSGSVDNEGDDSVRLPGACRIRESACLSRAVLFNYQLKY